MVIGLALMETQSAPSAREGEYNKFTKLNSTFKTRGFLDLYHVSFSLMAVMNMVQKAAKINRYFNP